MSAFIRLVFLAVLSACIIVAAHAGSDVIILYTGYGQPDSAEIEGRVVEARKLVQPQLADNWWTNLKRSWRVFINDERKGKTVTVSVAGREWEVISDDEGYIKVSIDANLPLAAGWHQATARIGDSATQGKVLIVPPANTVGLISDIDDTILISDVTEKRRLLKNTFLKNPHQRQAVQGTSNFYRRIAERNPVSSAAPVFYLSASPRQLSTQIQAFLDINGFPPGVLITKRVTNDETSEPLVDQVAYKTAKIEEIFVRLPHVRFVLVGDDGEYDPEIYNAIRTRHPTRVEAVWIRRVHPDPARPTFPNQLDIVRALDIAPDKIMRTGSSDRKQ